jgi:hypothetical protein
MLSTVTFGIIAIIIIVILGTKQQENWNTFQQEILEQSSSF